MQQNEYVHGGNVWEKEDPHAWLDFSANINPLGMPDAFADAMREANANIGYYPDPYSAAAADSAARYLGTAPETILLTNGGIEALRVASAYFAPQHCLIPVPCFCEYRRFAVGAGAVLETVAPVVSENGYALDIAAIKAGMRRGSLAFLCNPANPTGAATSPDELLDLLHAALLAGANMIVDEAFIDFCPEYSIRKQITGFDNAVIAGSLTKFFGIPGLRLGYLCANAKTIAEIKRKMPPWNVNAFAQAAAKALEGTQEFSRKTRLETQENRNALRKGLSTLHFTVYGSHANYLLANGRAIGITAAELNRRLAAHKMLIRDCANYEGLGEYDFRVAVKSGRDNARLIAAIGSVLAP